MRKIIRNNTIAFYDDNDIEIMYLDFSRDECIWFFNSSDLIKITKDMELYNLLEQFMKQEYIFSSEGLRNYKDKNKLIWYSDCYYNPYDEWSIDSVSCLNIEYQESCFNIWCTKKLDEKITRTPKFHCICFSPSGNGSYSKNINTGATLQDDFVVLVYHQLLYGRQKNKIRKPR